MSGGGFGYGPFGQVPFGFSAWARTVRYDLLPEFYRTEDLRQGGPLSLYVDGITPPYEELRTRARELPDLRDPLRVQGETSVVLPAALGPVVVRYGTREQYGVDASVLSLREFASPTARFTSADREKYLIVSRSTHPANNRTVRIALVVSPSTVLTDPPLAVDAGPLQWEVRASADGSADHVVLELVAGDAIRVRPGWVLFDGQAEYTVLARRIFPDRVDVHVPPIVMQGDDGEVDASGRFSAPSLTAASADFGCPVVLTDSILQANRGRFLLGPVVSPGVVKLLDADGNPVTLLEDAGPLQWALLPRSQITIRGPALPQGLEEQAGLDLSIGSAGVTVTATMPSARFEVGRDEGKVCVLIYPTAVFETTVDAVLTETSVTLSSWEGDTLPITSSPIAWRLRTRTVTSTFSPSRVELRAPSFLPNLAADFGLTVDRSEQDLLQRAWVHHVAAWTLLKGNAKGYEVIGALSGAPLTPQALYRISQEVAALIPGGAYVELVDAGTGRTGTDGRMDPGTLEPIEFFSPTALFVGSDEGRQIRITGSGHSGNNKLYTIAHVLDAHTVVFRPEDTATRPDTGLTWHILRLYTTNPPLMARFDDFDADLMEQLIDGLPVQSTDHWSIDRWCWEAGTVESFSITVTAATVLPPDRYTVTVSGRADVVTSVGAWKIVDSAGRTFFLETVPVSVDPMVPSFSFQVATAAPPALGAGTLAYVCTPALSCDYCAASKVLATVVFEPSGIPDPVIAQFKERLRRHLDEVLPAHVEVIVVYESPP